MNKIELGKEYEIKVGEFNNVPILFQKDDIRAMLTDIIDGDGSTYWCDSCIIKKEAEIPIPHDSGYEPEAETLANGGTLEFSLIEPFEDYEENGEIKEIENYELTLDKLIHAVEMVLSTMDDIDRRNILEYDKVNEKCYLDMSMVDGVMDDNILQIALFDDIVFG